MFSKWWIERTKEGWSTRLKCKHILRGLRFHSIGFIQNIKSIIKLNIKE